MIGAVEFVDLNRIAALRMAALKAGMRPVAFETDGPVALPVGIEGPGHYLGMKHLPGGLKTAVLALPNRRIGRYECVIPTRFEEPEA